MDFSDFLKKAPVWVQSTRYDTVSLYSAVRVSRNYNDIVYPDKISGPQLTTVETLTDRVLNPLLDSGAVVKINLESLSDNEVLILSEKRLLPYLKLSERNYIRLYMLTDLPVFLLLNYKDHLTFFSFSANENFQKAHKNLQKMYKLFDEKSFQHNPEYGFLTSDLNFCGTGTKYFMVADLPYSRYASKVFQLTSALKHNSMLYTRFFGQGSDLEDLLVIANKDSFADSTDEAMLLMSELHEQLQIQEMERKLLFEEADTEQILKRVRNFLERENCTFKNYLELYFGLIILADRGYDKRISRNWLRKKMYEYLPGHFSAIQGRLLAQNEIGKMIAAELKTKFSFLRG